MNYFRVVVSIISLFALMMASGCSIRHVSIPAPVTPVSEPAAENTPEDASEIEEPVSPLNTRSAWPWSRSVQCSLGNYSHFGLHPSALERIEELDLEHRITQAMNPSDKPSNYHGPDSIVGENDVTSAIDLSVRCLSDDDIKLLLDELASRNIVGWLRRGGMDGWNSADHVHALWVRAELKPQLQSQLHAWLVNRNGLRSDLPYQFWTPGKSDVARLKEYAF